MAKSNLSALLSLLFLISISFRTLAAQNDVVASAICPRTKNPPFCATVVQSAATADLKVLAGYTLNLAHTNAGDSLCLARLLAATAASPLLKWRYSSCSASYDGAFAQIRQAQKHLADGDYLDVTDLTTGVVAAVAKCLAKFKKPPPDASGLTKNGKTLEDLCSIVLVLADLLPGVRTDGNGNQRM
ncbi:pectinesterase inhibitor-like [Benincasa hispida]|uniref:pectinesterase inhibitor-like n=1 Tax=Benincasa hispida TaxID=102211 RepID=UPI0019010307|nr:pectinesterase inhibitor-like [Benincasa hispida]